MKRAAQKIITTTSCLRVWTQKAAGDVIKSMTACNRCPRLLSPLLYDEFARRWLDVECRPFPKCFALCTSWFENCAVNHPSTERFVLLCVESILYANLVVPINYQPHYMCLVRQSSKNWFFSMVYLCITSQPKLRLSPSSALAANWPVYWHKLMIPCWT